MPRVAPPVALDPTTKAALDRLLRSPSASQGLAQRSRIILAASAGKTNQQIARELRMPEVTVGKWRRGFALQGLEGLRDAPRSGRPLKHGPEIIQRVQNRACQQPEHYSRWSVRTLAQDLKLPRSTVHQILVASHLQPHRIRTFTFSPDPDFEAKLLDIVGLYLNPPENALVLCVDEKTGTQALDRTQPRQETAQLDQRVCPPRYPDLAGGAGDCQRSSGGPGQATPHLGQLPALPQGCRRSLPRTRLAHGSRQSQHPQKPSGAALAEAASPGALPLHPDPRFLGQHGGMFLQHSGQAGSVTKRSHLEAPTEGISVGLHCA